MSNLQESKIIEIDSLEWKEMIQELEEELRKIKPWSREKIKAKYAQFDFKNKKWFSSKRDALEVGCYIYKNHFWIVNAHDYKGVNNYYITSKVDPFIQKALDFSEISSKEYRLENEYKGYTYVKINCNGIFC